MYMAREGAINNNIEKLSLHFILLSFGVLALLYLIFLGNMVKNIVERRSLEARAVSLSNEVRNLEVTYLSLSKGVDLPMSYSMGFKETKATFVSRKSVNSLGLNSGETFGNTEIAKNNDL
ncbi:hypothetical protein A2917_00735 [Candidatus Nomurabacteria bacterium RIFCSPLOWO2_01_FULL_42_17]|uniref:Cell division protein FtsL n=1 Tax=Candidatus Nomurabacteria bacterium RIFCSPLOWO2_01_FULL_42_17 TaxID=1801780 RepID=A0A1F6XM21_9BACT|nr:MAG: hypothetical protein A2917_00735 [Candidatus Nomurabacteria bacterium RIFCSPLOWO2_01_FULL_42_17]